MVQPAFFALPSGKTADRTEVKQSCRRAIAGNEPAGRLEK
jgi:hypothetical protein